MDDFFNQSENSMTRIGDQAPAFRSVTTQGTIYFPADYFGKWVILFSYPTDFIPESTSGLMPFANMQDDFKALNCELIGLPVARSSFIKEKMEDKGVKDMIIKFPLIEDIAFDVARKYGIIQQDNRNPKAGRTVFFIDPECMIRALIQYPISLDLNFDELKRVIIALQTENEAISLPAKSSVLTKKLMDAKKESKKYNDWLFCTRELSEEKVMNIN